MDHGGSGKHRTDMYINSFDKSPLRLIVMAEKKLTKTLTWMEIRTFAIVIFAIFFFQDCNLFRNHLFSFVCLCGMCVQSDIILAWSEL